jgi:hypothetical protein
MEDGSAQASRACLGYAARGRGAGGGLSTDTPTARAGQEGRAGFKRGGGTMARRSVDSSPLEPDLADGGLAVADQWVSQCCSQHG